MHRLLVALENESPAFGAAFRDLASLAFLNILDCSDYGGGVAQISRTLPEEVVEEEDELKDEEVAVVVVGGRMLNCTVQRFDTDERYHD